jgi:hypothetical protein
VAVDAAAVAAGCDQSAVMRRDALGDGGGVTQGAADGFVLEGIEADFEGFFLGGGAGPCDVIPGYEKKFALAAVSLGSSRALVSADSLCYRPGGRVRDSGIGRVTTINSAQ